MLLMFMQLREVPRNANNTVWRKVSEGSALSCYVGFNPDVPNKTVFPADCPHPAHFHFRLSSASSAGFSEFPAYSQIFRQHGPELSS
jgi:hypothetical protein